MISKPLSILKYRFSAPFVAEAVYQLLICKSSKPKSCKYKKEKKNQLSISKKSTQVNRWLKWSDYRDYQSEDMNDN